MASASSQGAPPPMGTALREAKRAVRDDAQAARDALPMAAWETASRAIADKIIALPSFAAAHAVLITIPFRSEWNARLVAAAALAAGKAVVSPRVDSGARMLTLHRVADLDHDVAPGYRGIPEPLPRCAPFPAAAIDWVLVPGVAFDVAGRRLGYGGGYYDRLLPLVPRRAPRIAGAFDVQLVAAVPTGPHDLIVDSIVTETRQIAISPSADR